MRGAWRVQLPLHGEVRVEDDELRSFLECDYRFLIVSSSS